MLRLMTNTDRTPLYFLGIFRISLGKIVLNVGGSGVWGVKIQKVLLIPEI